MQNASKFWLLFFIALCISTHVFAYPYAKYRNQRNIFLAAEKAFKKGNKKLYNTYLQELKDYPLYPYLIYNELNNQVNKLPFEQLQNFAEKYPDFPLIPKLYDAWLYAMAKDQKWHEYLQGYKNSHNPELQCYYIWAHYQVHKDPKILKHVDTLWLNGNSLPKCFDLIFNAWEKANLMTYPLVWQRIKLAMKASNPRLARHLAKKLNPSERGLVELWIRTNDDPYIINKSHYFASKHPVILEILIHGIIKISKKDPKVAINSWLQIAKRHTFNEQHWAYIVKAIAISLANDKHPEAYNWLKKIPIKYIDKSVVDARLRLALYKQDWQNIIDIFHEYKFPWLEKNEKLLYWKARSLAITGNKISSQEILSELAKNRSYYGFLSSLRISKPYSLQNKTIKINESELAITSQKIALTRAYELYQLGRIDQSNIEWYYAIKNMADKEKEIAAIIAARWRLPNWSIAALDKSNNKNDLMLRFPKTYAKYIFQESHRNNLDPALIFAITRQESAFVPTARSPAGALGLMQVAPKTAKMIARQENIRLKNTHDILRIDNNIRIGCKYFKLMLNRYKQNPILAMAAYNAGPNRIENWLSKDSMTADSWIESIPYKETRNHIKNVLTYTIIYQQLLGKKPTLAKYMPVVSGYTQIARK